MYPTVGAPVLPEVNDEKNLRLAKEITLTCAFLTIGIGIMALLGWALSIPSLRGLGIPVLEMKATAALGFILAGGSLLFLLDSAPRWRQIIGNILASLVALLGLGSMGGHLFGWNFTLFSDFLLWLGVPKEAVAVNMVAASAFNFIVKGLALLTLNWETKRGHRPAQYLSLISAIAPLQVLVAYGNGIYSILDVGASPYITQMSPHTAVAWLTLTVGTLCSRPRAGFLQGVFSPHPASKILRRLLVFAVVVPPALAWLARQGEHLNFYHPGFTSSLFTLLSMFLLLGLILSGVQKIAAYDALLEQKAKELQRSNKAFQEFAFIASHDLKEPLRTISLYVQLLKEKMPEKPDGATEEAMNVITNGTQKMAALIDGWLRYSKIGQGRVKFVELNLNTVLGEVLSTLKPTLESTKATIDIVPLPNIVGDEALIIQLFQNLIHNAVKYRRDPCQIRIQCSHIGGQDVFSVADNGRGFDPAQSEEVFKLFRRISHDQPGTGIGLATCKLIVEHHQGRIWAESTPGVGSTFFFTLPRPSKQKTAASLSK